MGALNLVGRVAVHVAATLFIASIVVFLGMHMIPNGFSAMFVDLNLPEASRKAILHSYGLDRPLPVQYWHWLGRAVHGDLGTSMITRQSVAHDFAQRAPVTLELTLIAVVIALILGVSIGLVAALAAHRPITSGVSRIMSGSGVALPSFVVGAALVYVFSVHHLWLTVGGGYVPFSQSPVANLRIMLLPALTLAFGMSSLIIRMTRDSVLTVLAEPYINAAVARGESRWETVRRHVIRNAAGPLVTIVALTTAGLLSGALIVENVFSIPGLGQYLVSAARAQDYTAIQAGALVSVGAFVMLSALAELLRGMLDPRIRSAH